MKYIIIGLMILTLALAACTETIGPGTDPNNENNLLKDCKTWFDGCNTCFVEDGKIGACTEIYCEEPGEPRCLDDEETTEVPDETVCTAEYDPVCGKVQVQCVTTPCDPIDQTFSNGCEAEKAGAYDIKEGACVVGEPIGTSLKELCMITEGANWLEEHGECEYISQDACESLEGTTFDECGSACRHNEDPEVTCTLQCVPYCELA